MMVDYSYVEALRAVADAARAVVGTGPFKFVEWVALIDALEALDKEW